MSRCFPYPPPGFAGKSTSEEALILSIKLQEGEKAKSERRKDRRREKKEKKEKKNKKHDKTPSGDKKSFTEEKLNQADDKYLKHIKLRTQSKESSYDQTEKSTLTEEHGKPCCSSDSTENSGKRKRLSVLPTATNSIRSSGTVIRIRLSNKKRDDPPTPTSGNAALCSTSAGSDVHVQALASSIPKASGATLKLEAPSRPGKEILEAPSLKKEAKLPRPLRKYEALFNSWVPPQLEPETPDDEEDWLFSSKKEAVTFQPAKRLKCCGEEAPISESPALQPRARLLSSAGVYALPFTVPF